MLTLPDGAVGAVKGRFSDRSWRSFSSRSLLVIVKVGRDPEEGAAPVGWVGVKVEEGVEVEEGELLPGPKARRALARRSIKKCLNSST